MRMHRNAVFGIVHGEDRARDLVEALHDEGFDTEDISVAFPRKEGAKDMPEGTKAAEGAATGAGVGGVVGGAVGWLAAAGVIAVPGIGPLVAAGALLAALGGAAAGAAAGGIAGGLVGLGISEDQARVYEGEIRRGNILVSVHVDGPKDVTRAMEVFDEVGAQHVSSAAEAKSIA
jgi:hypothetical protein